MPLHPTPFTHRHLLAAAALAVLGLPTVSQAAAGALAQADGGTYIVNAAGTLKTPLNLTTYTLPNGGHGVSGEAQSLSRTSDGAVSAASLSGMAEASPGLLRARADAVALAGPSPSNPSLPSNETPKAIGIFSAQFYDTFELQSSTLPQGALAQYTVTLVFDMSNNSNYGGRYNYNFQLGTLGQPNAVEVWRHTPFSWDPSRQQLMEAGTYGFTYPVTVTAGVGDTVWMQQLLSVSAEQLDHPYTDNSGHYWGSETHIDASHTAKVFIDVITPGVSMVTASGHDYATSAAPVPEPAAAGLMLAGLGVVGAMRRWGRRGAASATPV